MSNRNERMHTIAATIYEYFAKVYQFAGARKLYMRYGNGETEEVSRLAANKILDNFELLEREAYNEGVNACINSLNDFRETLVPRIHYFHREILSARISELRTLFKVAPYTADAPQEDSTPAECWAGDKPTDYYTDMIARLESKARLSPHGHEAAKLWLDAAAALRALMRDIESRNEALAEYHDIEQTNAELLDNLETANAKNASLFNETVKQDGAIADMKDTIKHLGSVIASRDRHIAALRSTNISHVSDKAAMRKDIEDLRRNNRGLMRELTELRDLNTIEIYDMRGEVVEEVKGSPAHELNAYSGRGELQLADLAAVDLEKLEIAYLAASFNRDPKTITEAERGFMGLVFGGMLSGEHAKQRFPQPNYVVAKFAEESGEVVRGCIHFAEDRGEALAVADEMSQVFAMAWRLYSEGDQTVNMPSLAEYL